MSVKIICDSTAYLPKKYIDKYDIQVISLSVNFDNETFRELDIDNDFFYNKLDEYGKIPKSSQPSVEELYQTFLTNAQNNHKVIAVFISSDMSGTYSTAQLAKQMVVEEYPEAEIEIIDSRSNCMQMGFVVLAAAKAIENGKSFEEAVKLAKESRKKSRFIFIPQTLDYLRMGGRIGSAKALIGKVLRIKPLLTVKNGKTDVLASIRTRKKAIEKIIDIFLSDIKEFGFSDVVVHHINCYDDAKEVADMFNERFDKEISIVDIGPVVGTHAGPGAIGVVYSTINNLNI